MLSRRFVTSMILMLILAYLGALAVSTAHLSQLYALFNAGLPYWVSIGLAVALEAVAFLFSIISTSLGKRAGPWAAPASTSALMLVWAGNGYAMTRAAPMLEWYVVLGASCFVPVCTLFVGKVLGGQFTLLDELGQQEREPVAPQQVVLDTGTTSGPPGDQKQRVSLSVRATPVAPPVAQQTIQHRPVAASPIRRSPPPSVRRAAITDDSSVFSPRTLVADHSETTEAAVQRAVTAAPPMPSAHASKSDLPGLDTDFKNTLSELSSSDEPLLPTRVTGETSQNMSSAWKSQPELPVLAEQTQQEPRPPAHSIAAQEVRDPVAPEPTGRMVAAPLGIAPTTDHSDSVTEPLGSSQCQDLSGTPVTESALAPAQASTDGPRKANSATPRKRKLDLTGVGGLSDAALWQVGISRAELNGLAQLVTDGWPPTNTERLLSAEKAVLAWAYVGAKASKSALAVELGLGQKEWVVRDAVKSVEAVLEAVRTSHAAGTETRHVHVSDQEGEDPEAAAGDAQGPDEFGSPDANMGEQGGQA
ncbi:hypothetical protein Q0M94_06340 [Deinococcus radiomollis]|uniref:hypothetical protein n=1 Tax=Deinococcus radiomollis TaxID=468916 RepID=UPI003891EC23